MLTRRGAHAAFADVAWVMGPWLIDRPILCSSWVTSLSSLLERRKWEWNYNTNHVTSSGDRRKENTITVSTHTHTVFISALCWWRNTRTHAHVSIVFNCLLFWPVLVLKMTSTPVVWTIKSGWKQARLWTCSRFIMVLVLILQAIPEERGVVSNKPDQTVSGCRLFICQTHLLPREIWIKDSNYATRQVQMKLNLFYRLSSCRDNYF